MAYIQQVCEGYSKKTLSGNWYEERLYPNQPFRENLQKQGRGKDQAITTLDGTGFQRALPRLERRTKWDTRERIILNDGIGFQHSQSKGVYPNGQTQKTGGEITRPFDKNLDSVRGTDLHPNSQVRAKQKSYHYVNHNNINEQGVQRGVQMYGSDFKSSLPQQPQTIKQKRYGSIYGKSFGNIHQDTLTKTQSQFMKTRNEAGHFIPVTEENIKPLTTLVMEYRKDGGDEKEATGVQRSWVPQRDKALSYSVGKGTLDFQNSNFVRNDIQTSLNMNIGTHNLHPKLPEDGYFRHVRSVTVKPNGTPFSKP